MNKNYRERLLGAGERAENSIAWYCDLKNYKMIVPDADTKKNKGIDVFLNGRATDVKETKKISLGNYRGPNYLRSEKTKNKFLNRMPFNINCEAIDYLITEIDPINLTNKIVYHGPILEYLLQNYFIGEAEMLEGYKTLYEFQFKTPEKYGLKNGDELLQLLKNRLSKLIKPNISIEYTSSSILDYYPNTDEFQIFMIKNEDKAALVKKKNYYSAESRKGG